MKKHPAVIEDLGAIAGPSLSDKDRFIKSLVNTVRMDQDHTHTWLRRMRDYYERRYVRKWRKTSWPWPGSSDIVMPLIDMTIDRLKGPLSRTILTRPIASFKPRRHDLIERAKTNEMFFDWLLTERIDDFRSEVFVMLDTCLQYGFATVKCFWDYKTRVTKRIINFSDLPDEFLKVVPGITQFEANKRFFQNLDLLIDKKSLRQIATKNAEKIRGMISRNYDLDPEDDDDKKAINQIFDFFKNGKKEVIYETREIESDSPRMSVLNPEDFIVPRFACGIQTSPRCTQRLFLTESSLKARAKDQDWSANAIDYILSHRQSDQQSRGSLRSGTSVSVSEIERSRDDREGMLQHDLSDELIEIWEHHTFLDIGGEQRRVIFTLHPGTSTLLREPRENGFEHGKAPYVQIKFELNDNRFFSSRGVPEKLDDIDVEITNRHRNKLNNMDMLVPSFTVKMGTEVNPDSWHYQPGEGYHVVSHDDIRPLDIPDRTIPDEREENILLTWAERYLGGFENLAAQQNISEARTATEVNALQRTAQEVLGYRAQIMQIGMKEVYGMLWSLWQQWGPESVWITITGKRMLKVTKADIRGDFDIVPSGTIDNIDPRLEAQKALLRFQSTLQVAQLGPQVLGFEWQLDVGQAFANWIRRDSPVDADSVIRRRPQQEVDALKQRAAQVEQLIEAQQTNQPLTIPQHRAAIAEIQKNSPFGKQQTISAS